MFEKQEACPICGHLKHHNFHICTDHTVSGESFAIVKCAQCSHAFTNPRPTAARLPQYYQSAQYISHSNKITSPIDLIYKVVRQITLRQKEHLIRRLHKDTGSVLDFGCGTGHFIYYCQRHGWDVTAVEPDEGARTIAKKQIQNVYDSLTPIKKSFDVITAWHVLEHVPDPVNTLKELRNRLTPSGHLIVAVPNHLSYDAKHFGKEWAGYDVPRHLSHFNRSSMQTLAEKCKIKIIETLPMPFDAYYVTMLSLKYLTGKMNPLAAFKIGRKSNASAKLTGEYSSLIYVLKK